MNGWDAQAIERASKPKTAHSGGTSAPPSGKDTSKPPKAPQIEENQTLPTPTVGTYPGPCSWVLAYGRATVRLSKPFDPDRLRLVVSCAPDEALVAVVVEAIESYLLTQKPTT